MVTYDRPFSYTFTLSQLEAFKRVWPCHGLSDALASIRFEFAANGDLVDIEARNAGGYPIGPDYYDGPAASALADDGKTLAQGGKVDWLEGVSA